MRRLQNALLAAVACLAGLGAAPRVDVELATQPGLRMDESRKWIEALKDLGLGGIRIRTAREGDEERIERRGSAESPAYHVIGLLTDRNRLRVIGGEFSLNDRAAIAKWFAKLREDGIQALTEKPLAFGLGSEKLVGFHDKLARAVDASTKGRRVGDVARQIVQGLALPYEVSPAAKQAFSRGEECLDELQGLSSGTALAALLNPVGLAFAPRKISGSDLQLWIAERSEQRESWPVGWPAQDSPFKVAPTLFERLNVEIEDTPLSEALAAIQPRVKVPFLIDHYALAQQKIDLEKAKVKYPSAKATYIKILDQILFQAHLKTELRLDEAGRVFVWILPVRR